MGLSGAEGGRTGEPSSKVKHLEEFLATNQAMKRSMDTSALPEDPEEIHDQADHDAQDDRRREGEEEAKALFRYPDVARESSEPGQAAAGHEDAEHQEDDTGQDEYIPELSHDKSLYTTFQARGKAGFFPVPGVEQERRSPCLPPPFHGKGAPDACEWNPEEERMRAHLVLETEGLTPLPGAPENTTGKSHGYRSSCVLSLHTGPTRKLCASEHTRMIHSPEVP